MTFINTTAPELAEGATLAMYQRQQVAWGYVPIYAKVFSHRPEVMARWGQLLAEIKRPMDPRRFELVTFAAAHELRHTACCVAHGDKLKAFFSPEEIVAIAEGIPVDALNEADKAMLRFSRQIARDASRVTRAQIDELKALGFSDEDVFDIAAAAAGRAFFTKLLDALGVDLDSPFLTLDERFREPLSVGRPIDETPCAVMPLAT